METEAPGARVRASAFDGPPVRSEVEAPAADMPEAGSAAAPGAPGPSAFRWTVDDAGLARILFDVPGRSVNAFDDRVMADLARVLEELAAAGGVIAAVLESGKTKGFAAGADVVEIERVTDREDARRKVVHGQKLFQRLALLPFPVVAAIDGACLGGGLEMALACAGRVAAPDAELGLPEVQLGIVPGWGGTQRLPRLVGVVAAADLICSGRRLTGKEALRIGLVDRLANAHELTRVAGELASHLASRGRPRRLKESFVVRLRRLALEANPVGRRIALAGARKRVRERTGGHYPAPLHALDLIAHAFEGSLEAGLALEARIAADLVVSPISKNLIHVFRLFEGVRKSPWAKAGEARPAVRLAAVLGAGVMGGGIAGVLALAGVWVRLEDLDTARVGLGLAGARRIVEERRRKRKLDRAGLRRALNRIAGTTDDSGLGRVDLVIEAIVEELEAKRAAFARLDAATPPRAILATNTSSLPVSKIASAVRDPGRVAGFHVFNPVERMPLVEVIRGPETRDQTVATLFALAVRLRKKPVVVKDAPGFLVNRLLMPYLNEALHLLGEGLEIRQVDDALTAFGMPVGPLALLDDIGLDVAYHAGRILSEAFPERMEPAPLFGALHASGRTGRKGGRGFYRYEGSTRKGADPGLLRALRGGHGPAEPARERVAAEDGRAEVSEIQRRLIFPMIDEAARCLAEGVVESADDVDLATVAGMGFPAFRGGLLRHADSIGTGAVVAVLDRLSLSAPRLRPSAALREVAGSGGFSRDVREDPFGLPGSD